MCETNDFVRWTASYVCCLCTDATYVVLSGIVGEVDKNAQAFYMWTHKKLDIGYNGDAIVDVNLTSEAKVKLEPGAHISFTYEVHFRACITVESVVSHSTIHYSSSSLYLLCKHQWMQGQLPTPNHPAFRVIVYIKDINRKKQKVTALDLVVIGWVCCSFQIITTSHFLCFLLIC